MPDPARFDVGESRPVPSAVISYAHQDQAVVRAVVRLMRSHPDFRDAVFWDEDFRPGRDWFEQICRAIEDSPVLYVFWCCHSSRSPQVARELAYAAERSKTLIHVLIDPATTPPELVGVDLRHVVSHAVCSSKLGRRIRRVLAGALLMAALAFVVAVAYQMAPTATLIVSGALGIVALVVAVGAVLLDGDRYSSGGPLGNYGRHHSGHHHGYSVPPDVEQSRTANQRRGEHNYRDYSYRPYDGSGRRFPGRSGGTGESGPILSETQIVQAFERIRPTTGQ